MKIKRGRMFDRIANRFAMIEWLIAGAIVFILIAVAVGTFVRRDQTERILSGECVPTDVTRAERESGSEYLAGAVARRLYSCDDGSHFWM